jgi:clan AA aspartic protease (TIGR02281 family)
MKVKKLLAAALLSTSLVGVSLPAHAAPFATYDVSCGASVLIIGTYSPNRDVNVSVVYDHGSWRVVHTLNNGDVYERGVQYDIADTSNTFRLMWAGTLRRNPAISMNAWLESSSGGQPVYVETMYKGDRIIMQSRANCALNSQPAYSPPVVAQAPAPAPTYAPSTQGGDRVPFIYAQGGMHVPVSLSGYPATMTIDTGATSITVTETLASQLVTNGQATYTGQMVNVTLADNSTRSEREISVNTLTVGSRTIHNVHGEVAPDGSDMLLGITVLARLSRKFAINTAASTLDFD